MSCLEELLAARANEIRAAVESRLRGFLGGMLRAYLPQVWVFRAEEEAVSVRVGADGRVTVVPGTADPADVTVEGSHDRLRSALTAGPEAPSAVGDLRVTSHTAKGRAAFGFVRQRLGL